MKQRYRLKKSEDFQTVIHKGHHEKSQQFIIYCYQSGHDVPRIGISAPVKLGKAVVRTTVRRQVRAMIDEVFDEIVSLDYVVIVKKTYFVNNYAKNCDDLRELFRKVRRKFDENKA